MKVLKADWHPPFPSHLMRVGLSRRGRGGKSTIRSKDMNVME
jgi:hypothetical protein